MEENEQNQENEETEQLEKVDDRMEGLKRFVKERGWGPLGSGMFHILVALMILGFSGGEPPVTQPSIEVMIDPAADKLEEKVEKKVEEKIDLENPDISAEVPTETEAVTTAENFEMPGDPTQSGGVGGGSAGFGMGSGAASDGVGFEMAFVKSPMTMKGLYASRRAGGTGGRAGAIKRGGGNNAGEQAVLKALRWLKAHQSEDGSWPGSGSQTAMCGLALLCYMAHGETPASKEFGVTVEKAIRYLMYAQEANGKFKNAGPNYSYGHAIATYALSESYGMTQMVLLKEPMEKAIQVIIDGQQAGGAFDYNYDKAARKDMSVSAWQVQALKAAKMAGAENKGLQDALYKCVDGIKSFAGPSGGFGYGGPGNSETLAGAGILCLQFLGHGEDPAVVNTFQATQNLSPTWPSGGGTTYGWYYMTQARYQKGGEMWKAWNAKMLPMLISNQQADGHWESGSTHGASPVYDTTLCCLCLEVYYRYLPTYIRSDEVKRPAKTANEAEAKLRTEIAL
ncbi:MAG: prenyltransferase/squalene oxidase repeat-containing protein [bacterium]